MSTPEKKKLTIILKVKPNGPVSQIKAHASLINTYVIINIMIYIKEVWIKGGIRGRERKDKRERGEN